MANKTVAPEYLHFVVDTDDVDNLMNSIYEYPDKDIKFSLEYIRDELFGQGGADPFIVSYKLEKITRVNITTVSEDVPLIKQTKAKTKKKKSKK